MAALLCRMQNGGIRYIGNNNSVFMALNIKNPMLNIRDVNAVPRAAVGRQSALTDLLPFWWSGH
jgi:hypothetical protein